MSLELYPDIHNQKVVHRNRLPTRAYHINPEHSLLLSGNWDFNYVRYPELSPDLSDPGCRASSDWASIPVPSHWQLQLDEKTGQPKYGTPHYTNTIFPFPVDPPNPPAENPTGSYETAFNVPSNWNGGSLRVRFEGVDNCYQVFLNHKFVGFSKGSRNSAEFDVTKFVHKDGKVNILGVKVFQFSDSSYIEDQDQWWLSGIFRDVYLLHFPSQGHIEDFKIRTLFDDKTYTDGHIDLDLQLVSEGGDITIKTTVIDASGETIIEKKVDVETLTPKLSFELKSPFHWTAETPYLYKYSIDMFIGGKIVYSVSDQSVGFRQVEMINGNICVNGKAILLKGVNRHDHHPRYGRAVPFEFLKRDLLIMKTHNINAIRTSHYPSDPRFYQLASELGFWVLDEADLEAHGFYDAIAKPKDIPESMDYEDRKKLTFPIAAQYTSNNPEWKEAYLDRARQLIHRDFNHTCVVIWSLGNEAFYGCNQKDMYKLIKEIDKDRPIHYEGDPEAETADMFSLMYPPLSVIEDFVKDAGDNFEKPLVLCEYAHAMGNGPGLLREYQELFYKNRSLQGGFIWEWANHGLEYYPHSNKNFSSGVEDKGPMQYGYGGDFGEYPHSGVSLMDGLCNSEHNPTPGLIEFKKVIEPVSFNLLLSPTNKVQLELKNLYDFTTLDNLNFSFKVEKFSENPVRLSTVLKSGSIDDISKVNAGETALIDMDRTLLDFGPLYKEDEVYLTVYATLKHPEEWADTGFEIAWEQFNLTKHASMDIIASLNPVYTLFDHSAVVQETKSEVNIKGDLFSISFDKVKASIIDYTIKNHTVIDGGKSGEATNSLTFWRAPTNNDTPVDFVHWEIFEIHRLKTNVRKVTVTEIAPKFVEVKFDIFISPAILNWGFDTTITYTVDTSSGGFKVHSVLKPRGNYIPESLPRLGFEFTLNDALNYVTYLGRGPGESYPDKKESQRVGIYNYDIDKVLTTQFQYDYPQENGNRADTRWVKVSSGDGFGIKVTRLDSSDNFHFKASNDHNLQAAQHPCDVVKGPNYLRIDHGMHGLGTGSCGPKVTEPYRLKVQDFDFTFSVQPF